MKLLGLVLVAWGLFSSRVGISSWYGASWDGEQTANGEIFDHAKRTLANKTWPMSRWCFLMNLENGRISFAWLNDRGPYIEGREFDVSETVARDLGFLEAGTARILAIHF